MAVIANPVPRALIDLGTLADHNNAEGKIVAFGRLSPEKRFDHLIRAFAGAFDARTGWTLDIWGEGPQRDPLTQLIRDLGIAGRVSLCGSTSRPWPLMLGAQVFALTSEYEGFPNALMEAQALGLACVAYDCPSGPRELSNHGRAAVLVRSGDIEGMGRELRRLADDAGLRQTMGRAAAEFTRSMCAEEAVLGEWNRVLSEVC